MPLFFKKDEIPGTDAAGNHSMQKHTPSYESQMFGILDLEHIVFDCSHFPMCM